MKTMLIIGATSAIAEHVARRMCGKVDKFYLLGRDEAKTRAIADDLRVRCSALVDYHACDLTMNTGHNNIVQAVVAFLGKIDITLIAYGTLTEQEHANCDIEYTLSEIHINFTSVVSWLTVLAGLLEAQGNGQLAVISSVAGDRGRQSNYVYGAAKAGLSTYLQGLRNRLAQKNIHVLTVKPGFVDTPMTADFKKGLLWVGPDKVAKDIVKALDKHQDILYTPWYWRWIMMIIKSIPEFIFKKLKL
jgi:short-subunit dehydrogenase